MTFGRPAMISTSWDVPFPALIDDEYLCIEGEGKQPRDTPSRLGLLVWSSKLFQILDDILLRLYVPHPQRSGYAMSEPDFSSQQIISDIVALNNRIDDFAETIPAYLHPGDKPGWLSSPRDMSVVIQQQILHCRYGGSFYLGT
jgi:hypothetical protein